MLYPGMVHSKILLICDQHAVAQMILMLLKTKGYAVQIAQTPQEGLILLNHEVDLVLIDLISSDEEVYQCCADIKVNVQTQHVPLIVLSSSKDVKVKLQVLQLHIDDYINKPVEPQELLLRVSTACRRHYSTSIIDQQRQIQTLKEIQSILTHRKIVPFFQPIYYLKPKRILGFEMLSRPQTDTFLYNPETFFKEAMKVGLYMDVEMLAWDKALGVFSQNSSVNDFKIFLNCSPYLVESDKFEEIREVFNHFNINSGRIVLEITERSSINEYPLFYERLNRYRQEGFGIAVDDVGGGYSSLETIVQTKPNAVKIDRHIINGLTTDTIKQSIVKLLVAFCQENSIICVAEGIENEEDLNTVIALGVTAGQGYYLCRPKENLSECLV